MPREPFKLVDWEGVSDVISPESIARVTDFLTLEVRHYVRGEYVRSLSGATFQTTDPATGVTLADVSYGEREDVDAAVAAATEAVEWSEASAYEKARVLNSLADLIERDAQEFILLDCLDNGKPWQFARDADVPNSVKLFRYYAGLTHTLEGRTLRVDTPRFAYTLREPVGVVAQIIPWNFPLMMAAWKLAPALAAGCRVILKPAEQTPLSASYLARLASEAGLPNGVLNIIQGDGETGALLAEHPNIDKVAFTGSGETGRKVARAALGNLKKVSLELGGKSPHILFADADLSKALPDLAEGIFWNQGQCCSAGSRILVEESVMSEALDALRDAANRVVIGPSFSGSTMGPLISSEQKARVGRYVELAREAGDEIVIGGEPLSGNFFPPTVIRSQLNSLRHNQEEIFGPVCSVMPFRSEDEAVKLANDTVYGLAAGIWTGSISRAHRLARRLKVGIVWVNGYNVADPSLPFGGYKESGWGREMGPEALDAYLETKSVTIGL